MKKNISLILALVMALSLLPGCTPADAALWAAMKRTGEAENYTLTTGMSWDVTVHEPFHTDILIDDGFYTPEETAEMDKVFNGFINVLGLLAQDMTLDATTVKNGDDFKVDMRFAKPDLRLFFTFWQQMEEGAVARQIVKIPSLFITSATRGKDYIVFNKSNDTEQLQASAEYAESLNKLAEYVGKRLSPLADEAEVTGSANVYTVRIDATTLLKIADETVDAITSDEGTDLVIDVYAKYMENVVEQLATVSGESVEELRAEMELPTAEEARAIYDEAMRDAKLYVEAIGEQIEKSGLLKNGVTLRYTVNSDGLIEKAESEIVLDIDVEALTAAFTEIFAIFDGTGADTYTNPYYSTKGSFTVTFKTTSIYDYSPTEVTMPEITEQNSVDIMAELAEYQEYTDARYEWNRKWQRYTLPVYLYDEENPDNLPLTVRNLSNGKETVITPVKNGYNLYFPVKELVNVLDDATVTWNQTLMAVELSTVVDGEKRTYIIPNDNGKAYYEAYFEGPWDWSEENGNGYVGDVLSDEYISEAQRTLIQTEDNYEYYKWMLYYRSYFDENGTSYINPSILTNDLGYVLNLEGTVLSIDFEENEQFEYDESIEDNFFYKLYDDMYSMILF